VLQPITKLSDSSKCPGFPILKSNFVFQQKTVLSAFASEPNPHYDSKNIRANTAEEAARDPAKMCAGHRGERARFPGPSPGAGTASLPLGADSELAVWSTPNYTLER